MGLKKAGDVRTEESSADERRHARGYEGLLRQLEDPDPSIRRWAARDLSLHPSAAGPLAQRLAEEPETDVREAIAASLEVIGGGRTVEGLIPLLHSDEAGLRNTAIEILQHLPDDVAVHIERLLSEPDSDLRIFAVNIMETVPHPRSEEWLCAVLHDDPHVNVVAAALNLLSEVASERALAAVEQASRRFSTEPFIQFACQTVKKRIRSL